MLSVYTGPAEEVCFARVLPCNWQSKDKGRRVRCQLSLHSVVAFCLQHMLLMINFYTAPSRGTGYCFRAISLFLCLFLCQQHYEKTAGPVYMKFSGKVWSDHGTTWFWVNSDKRVGGSKVNRRLPSKNRIVAVILFFRPSLISLRKFPDCSVVHRGHSYLVWLWSSGSPVLPPSDWECNEIAVLAFIYVVARGRGLLCPAPQLVLHVTTV